MPALFALAVPLLFGLWVWWMHRLHPELRWDWREIDATRARLPKDLLLGAATSAHQVEGNMPDSNWTRFEASLDAVGRSPIKGGKGAGLACDHYRRFREDLDRLKALGLSAYRFSVEWSRIEPRPGEYDEKELAHYGEVVDACLERGLEPMVTLHHFTHPGWFEDLGGFEQPANVEHFVRFSRKVFETLSDRVRLWATINEPNVFVVQGFLFGIFPPGVMSLSRAARTYWGLMLAHTEVYRALKAMPNGDRASIGLVMTLFQLDPFRRYSPIDWLAARVGNAFFNDAALAFLKTGVFEVGIRGWRRFVRTDARGRGAGDFLGLNYYSHVRVTVGPTKPYLSARYRPEEVMTDMPYAAYPEGFYRALKSAAGVGMPIYVTENGIADAKDDRRELFIDRYLYALSRAIEDGVDVRGYFYLSLLDNFEWSEGYGMRFGLYEVDYETQERRLRRGSEALRRAADRAREDRAREDGATRAASRRADAEVG